MGLFNKLLLVVLVLALASPFVLKKPDGQPILDIANILKPAQDLTHSISPNTQPQTLYRWQDNKGRWQFSDTPAENVNAEKITVEDKISSMKTIELPEDYSSSAKQPKRFDPTDANEGPSIPITTAPIEKVPEMLEQIQNFQQSLDNRKQQLDNIHH